MTKTRAPDPFPYFKTTGVPEDFAEIDRNIDVIADRLIARLAAADASSAKCGQGAEANLKAEDIRFLAYAAIAYRVRRGMAPSESHLRLLAAVLGVRSGRRAPSGAAAYVGLPSIDNGNLEAFLRAADRQAIDPEITVGALARHAGIDRKTLREWQAMEAFETRRRATRYRDNPNDHDRAIQKGWDEAAARIAAEIKASQKKRRGH